MQFGRWPRPPVQCFSEALRYVRCVECSIDSLIDEIRRQRLYSYARYGDGEFLAVLGQYGNNNYEHTRTPELQTAMIRILESQPRYRVATVQDYARMTHSPFGEMWKWLRDRQIDLPWYDACVFSQSVIDSAQAGTICQMINFLRQPEGLASLVIVGPQHLAGLSRLFKFSDHVVTPDVDCFDDRERIEQEIRAAFDSLPKPVLCLISASITAVILIDDLYDDLGDKGWLIDVGAMWNPYVGKQNRSYWERLPPVVV